MNNWQKVYMRMTAEGPQSISTSILFWGLRPLSCLYRMLMQARASLYRSGLKRGYKATVPVVSVGNITTGGTGKTPMIDFLAKDLVCRNVKCAIVSRGYGGSYTEVVGRVADASGHLQMPPQECGDEPYLLAVRNPGVAVYVARQRQLGVQAAEQDGAQLILLDDGFQHLAVQRDVNILLLDATHPFGNGCLLPAGKLREPLSAMKRADIVVMTRSIRVEKPVLPVDVPVLHCRHKADKTLKNFDGEEVLAETYAGKSCLAFAGIAQPEDFFAALRGFGFASIEEMPLSDHQEYSPEILNQLSGSCHNYDFMVTTEKDAVKLSAVKFPKPCYQLGVTMAFDDATLLTEEMGRLVGVANDRST